LEPSIRTSTSVKNPPDRAWVLDCARDLVRRLAIEDIDVQATVNDFNLQSKNPPGDND